MASYPAPSENLSVFTPSTFNSLTEVGPGIQFENGTIQTTAYTGGGGGSQTLAQTLVLGNSAGTTSIDMNNQNITNVNTIISPTATTLTVTGNTQITGNCQITGQLKIPSPYGGYNIANTTSGSQYGYCLPGLLATYLTTDFATSTIYFVPTFVAKDISVNAFAIRQTAASGVTSFKLGIALYTNDPITALPITKLADTSVNLVNVAPTGSIGRLTGSLSAPLILPRGYYWWSFINIDSITYGVAALRGYTNTNTTNIGSADGNCIMNLDSGNIFNTAYSATLSGSAPYSFPSTAPTLSQPTNPLAFKQMASYPCFCLQL
jgi:hypothetical protein